jgi:hydroxyacylglutathione hydrolase
MNIESIPVSPFMTNCYIVSCPDTDEAAIIDAGDEPEKLLTYIDENNLKLKYLINTHAHLDHVAAVIDIQKERSVPFLLHPNEKTVLEGLNQSQQLFGLPNSEAPKVDQYIDKNSEIKLGNLVFKIIETPGHTPGGICLLTGNHLIAGDTLFAGSIGRTDLPGGDTNTLLNSIQNQLMSLDDDIIVYPGHGPSTSIGIERKSNPFINNRYA